MLTTLYRAAADGTGIPEELYTGSSEEYFILSFALGRDDSLYFPEKAATQDGSALYCLQKLDSNLQEVYLTVPDHSDFSGNSFLNVSVYVDESGSLLLMGYDGSVYFFDPAGNKRAYGCARKCAKAVPCPGSIILRHHRLGQQ
ncbi:MAG: hypothetical protein K2J60_10995 [Acetatifactor sp.]|nr:hypothetical protein [Acetatifactor sp.]